MRYSAQHKPAPDARETVWTAVLLAAALLVPQLAGVGLPSDSPSDPSAVFPTVLSDRAIPATAQQGGAGLLSKCRPDSGITLSGQGPSAADGPRNLPADRWVSVRPAQSSRTSLFLNCILRI